MTFDLSEREREILNLIAHAFLGPGDEAIYTEHGFLVYRIAILAAGGAGTPGCTTWPSTCPTSPVSWGTGARRRRPP